MKNTSYLSDKLLFECLIYEKSFNYKPKLGIEIPFDVNCLIKRPTNTITCAFSYTHIYIERERKRTYNEGGGRQSITMKILFFMWKLNAVTKIDGEGLNKRQTYDDEAIENKYMCWLYDWAHSVCSGCVLFYFFFIRFVCCFIIIRSSEIYNHTK